MSDSSPPPSAGLRGKWSALAAARKAELLLMVVVVVVTAFAADMMITSRIDDDIAFSVPAADIPKGGSHAVAIMAALIDREVNQNPWVANSPFFMPTHYIDNMPNYQLGIVYALYRISLLLNDQVGRSRSTSQMDPDLDRATGLLKYPGTVWIIDPGTSLLPTASSQAQYRRAHQALLSYNTRLSEGKATFDPRSDNLVYVLDSIANDLGSQSSVIEQYMRGNHYWLWEDHSDDIFYQTKGRMYAYYLVLREMKTDFADVIRDRQLEAVWNNTLRSFREAVEMEPIVVINGRPDDQFLPSHLASQGFYLLRARTNLREMTGIILGK